MKVLLVLAFFLPVIAIGQTPTAAPESSTTIPTVRVEEVAPAIILYQDVRGDYSKHPEVFLNMMNYVGARYRAVGACFGIYPVDPDAAKRGELTWQVGVRVTSGAPLGFGKNIPVEQVKPASVSQLQRMMKQLKVPDAPYHLQIMPASLAGVVESTIATAASDGLYMFKWMAENGYVQIAPTRMEYLSHDGPPSQIPTRIIVPVKKRESGLKLAK